MLGVTDRARLLADAGHATWLERFNETFAQVAGEFENGLLRRARAYLLGLLSRTERKNFGTLAEFAGDLRSDGYSCCCFSTPGPRRLCVGTCRGTWASNYGADGG